jgi:hypothetical protein
MNTHSRRELKTGIDTIHWQYIRNQVLDMHLHDDEKRRYHLQGRMMRDMGYPLSEASIPTDTWVGRVRQAGWLEMDRFIRLNRMAIEPWEMEGYNESLPPSS